MLKLLKKMRRREVAMAAVCALLILAQIYFDLALPDYMTSLTKLLNTPGSATAEIMGIGGEMLACALASAARSAPRSIWPTASTGSSTSSCPRALRRRAGWRTAGCSTAVVTTFIDGPYQSAEPRIAVLSLSVAQEVK